MKINKAEVYRLYNKQGGWYVLIEMGNPNNQAEYTSKIFKQKINAENHLKGICKMFEWIGIRTTDTIIKNMPKI